MSSMTILNVRTKEKTMSSHSQRLVQKVWLMAHSNAESGSVGF